MRELFFVDIVQSRMRAGECCVVVNGQPHVMEIAGRQVRMSSSRRSTESRVAVRKSNAAWLSDVKLGPANIGEARPHFSF